VRGDMKRGRAGRPVPGGLLAANRPPGKDRSLQPELSGAFAGEVEGCVAPAERVGGGAWRRVREGREHEALGVPEGVPVVARPGQALGGDRSLLGAGTRLEGVEEGE